MYALLKRLFLTSIFIVALIMNPAIRSEAPESDITDERLAEVAGQVAKYIKVFEVGLGIPVSVEVEVIEDIEDFGLGILGICRVTVDPVTNEAKRLIQFSAEDWDWLTDNQRFILVIHELGHCQLNRKHDDRLRYDGCPLSIMYPQILPQTCIDKHGDDYLYQYGTLK